MAEKDYNKDQCVYGPNSDATCKFCSHMCKERGKGFKNRIIKGEFAKKLFDEVTRMRAQKLKKDYISNEKFDEEVNKTFHNIIVDDEVRETIQDMITKDINYHRWLILTMKTPLKDISLEDLQWASEQPYNSLTSKNIFLAEIERRKHES
jgi:hypothetical protein